MIAGARALIRADGGGRFGLGHVMRGLAVAEALRERGWDVGFVMARHPSCPSGAVQSRGFEVLLESPDVLEGGWRPEGEADLLWIDHHETSLEWMRQSRLWSRTIGVIDDLAERALECDLVVCPVPPEGAEAHYRKMAPAARLLLGPAYAPMAPGFSLRKGSCARTAEAIPRRVVVTFGGADRKNQTCKALEALAGLAGPLEVTVVVGEVNPHLREVKAAAAKLPHTARVFVDVGDMAALLADQQLAIGAAGDSALERCCLGLPAVVVVCAENQQFVAEWLRRERAAEVLGPWQEVTSGDIARAVDSLRSEPSALAAMAVRASGLVDGLGAVRIAEALEKIAVLRKNVPLVPVEGGRESS
ncbi:MAG: UDP-2,4-diacetamido-2,4,6-trideoxy-beta-L-altropyranose hydrolase [bacterium]|nr:UDP-2,4-diacetamido-2,4,6-trideoxy-beta-L-altropyranose hydrolase [bacterium]